MKLGDFGQLLDMLLSDQPRGTTANLSDFAVAWWNGQDVIYAFLRADQSGRIDEQFELDDFEWSVWKETFVAWLEAPRLSMHAEILACMDATSSNEPD